MREDLPCSIDTENETFHNVACRITRHRRLSNVTCRAEVRSAVLEVCSPNHRKEACFLWTISESARRYEIAHEGRKTRFLVEGRARVSFDFD